MDYIKYRDKLNFPDDVTFGVEIEYENADNDLINYYLYEMNNDNIVTNWRNRLELDFCYNVYDEFECVNKVLGGEVVSPILKDTKENWENLKDILNLLKDNHGNITEKCGAHVNIGSQILENDSNNLRKLLLVWMLYEKEIYKFSTGEFNRIRNNKASIKSIVPELKNYYYLLTDFDYNEKLKQLINLMDDLTDKSHDLSLAKVTGSKFELNNVIEFRLPNGSLNEEIWQNYINFYVKLLLKCRQDIDVEKLIYKIENKQHSIPDLCNFVFDDELDKENFLIQAEKKNKIYKKELKAHLQC